VRACACAGANRKRMAACPRLPRRRRRIGACSAAPLLLPHPQPRLTEEAALKSTVKLLPSSVPLNARALVEAGEPTLLRGAWPPAAQGSWSWKRLKSLLGEGILPDVALTDGYHYLPADAAAALSPLITHESAYAMRNLSARCVLDALEVADAASQHVSTDRIRARAFWRSGDTSRVSPSETYLSGRRFVWYGKLPASLRAELEPASGPLYASEFDERGQMQYAWLSTPSIRTHTHFDSDRNFFVQLIGRKRFVMWHPNQTSHLCPFPRLHPLWHKSRVDFELPDSRPAPCVNYSRSTALVADVEAGDVLYLPPFYWHTVETLSPSLSLSTISRWPQLYNHMNAIYTHEYLFDVLSDQAGKTYALRGFIALLTNKANSPRLVSKLVEQYAGLPGAFSSRSAGDGGHVCVLDGRGTPTCRWCLARIKMEVALVWDEHLIKLPADVRSTLLSEFVEEMAAQVLGAREAFPFLRDCAGADYPFFLTQQDSVEHSRLWRMR
jgi:hypothetical protein